MIVDDDIDFALARKQFLDNHKCNTHMAFDTFSAIEFILKNEYDCIILDVMLGTATGFKFCEEIRKITKCPIVFLSNISEDEYQKQGFISGGEDYISKLCDLELFWLRIETRIKNFRRPDFNNIIEYPPLKISLSSRTVIIDEQEVQLTYLQFEILTLLASNPKKVFSLSDIYKEIWRQDDLNQPQTVQVHISHMRRKLEQIYTKHYFLETVWGKGYRFSPTELK